MSTPYVSTEALLHRLKFENGVDPPTLAQVEAVREAVERQIDGVCQRHFYQNGTEQDPVERFFDVQRDPRIVRFGAFNDLVEITELATDQAGNGSFDRVWTDDEYQLLPLNPLVTPEPHPYQSLRAIHREFPRSLWHSGRRGRIRITGVWGWPSVPNAVREATLIQATRIYMRKHSPEGVVGFDQFGQVRVGTRMDPDVTHMLREYVHTQAAVLIA